MTIGYRPGIQKDRLNIEDDKQHRDEIKLDGESFAGGTDRGHAAFIRGEFLRGGPLGAKNTGKARPEVGDRYGGLRQ